MTIHSLEKYFNSVSPCSHPLFSYFSDLTIDKIKTYQIGLTLDKTGLKLIVRPSVRPTVIKLTFIRWSHVNDLGWTQGQREQS